MSREAVDMMPFNPGADAPCRFTQMTAQVTNPLARSISVFHRIRREPVGISAPRVAFEFMRRKKVK